MLTAGPAFGFGRVRKTLNGEWPQRRGRSPFGYQLRDDQADHRAKLKSMAGKPEGEVLAADW